jgi:hypothetical protein
MPATRPLRGSTGIEVRRRLEAAIANSDGLAGAHCIHELWKRAASSIPEWLPMTHVEWLPEIYEIAGRFAAGRKGRSNIYLILLDYRDRKGSPYGLYVGMSAYTPAQRFDQHKAGIRAAGSVLKRGLEVLAGPTLHLQRIARAEAERIEAELAAALGDAGFLVQGGH